MLSLSFSVYWFFTFSILIHNVCEVNDLTVTTDLCYDLIIILYTYILYTYNTRSTLISWVIRGVICVIIFNNTSCGTNILRGSSIINTALIKYPRIWPQLSYSISALILCGIRKGGRSVRLGQGRQLVTGATNWPPSCPPSWGTSQILGGPNKDCSRKNSLPLHCP